VRTVTSDVTLTKGGHVMVPSVRVAASFLARLRGLMGIRGLTSGAGLYLPGTNSIHMLFMRFPIDCLFLGHPESDGSRRVIAIRRSLPPWRGVVWYVRGARGVLELPAGTVDSLGLRVGDLVQLEKRGAAV
jgi:uncharacterized protein